MGGSIQGGLIIKPCASLLGFGRILWYPQRKGVFMMRVSKHMRAVTIAYRTCKTELIQSGAHAKGNYIHSNFFSCACLDHLMMNMKQLGLQSSQLAIGMSERAAVK